MSREVELKFELDAAGAALLRDDPLLGEPSREQQQLSVYYDTPKLKLRAAGFTLRVRKAGDGFVQTIKGEGTTAGLFDRPEWEAPVSGLEPDVDAAGATPLSEHLSPSLARKLKPLIRSEVKRTVWVIRHDDAEIEFVLDEGEVQADGSSHPIREAELELRQGEAEALVGLARRIGADVPVKIGVLSKAERGFGLVDGSLAKVAKAPVLELRREMRASEGFAAIILSCIKHFRLNEPLLIEQREAGALHQARVAMRRLRSALSLFRPMLRDDPAFPPLREELRWFTGQLGEARNLDVYLKRLDPHAPEREQLTQAREASYDRIIAVLGSHRFRQMMLDLLAWVLTGEWRSTKKAQRPLLAFSNRRIDRLWEHISVQGAELAQLEEEPRHQLRIDIKKIRYALEFVAGLHREVATRQKRFGSALEGLQEALGHLNDMATAREIAAAHSQAEAAAEAANADEERAQLKEAQKNFAALKSVGPYWRWA